MQDYENKAQAMTKYRRERTWISKTADGRKMSRQGVPGFRTWMAAQRFAQ